MEASWKLREATASEFQYDLLRAGSVIVEQQELGAHSMWTDDLVSTRSHSPSRGWGSSQDLNVRITCTHELFALTRDLSTTTQRMDMKLEGSWKVVYWTLTLSGMTSSQCLRGTLVQGSVFWQGSKMVHLKPP